MNEGKILFIIYTTRVVLRFKVREWDPHYLCGINALADDTFCFEGDVTNWILDDPGGSPKWIKFKLFKFLSKGYNCIELTDFFLVIPILSNLDFEFGSYLTLKFWHLDRLPLDTWHVEQRSIYDFESWDRNSGGENTGFVELVPTNKFIH